MANNPLLFNAALAGYMAGMLGGQGNPADPTATDYANLVTQAVAYATAVDLAIPLDPAITTAGAPNVALAPQATSPNVEDGQGKPPILFGLSFGAAFARFQGPMGTPAPPFVAQDFTTVGSPGQIMVAAIAAAYAQTRASIVDP
jgi:hypothetical protein